MAVNLVLWYKGVLTKFLPLQYFLLRLIGAWPSPNVPKWQIRLGIFYAVFTLAEAVTEISYPIFNRVNLQTALDSMGVSIEKFRVGFKLLCVIIQRKKFFVFLKEISELYEEHQEQTEVKKSRALARTSTIICSILTYFTWSTGFFLGFYPLMKNIFRLTQHEEWLPIVPFLAQYPWDYTKNKFVLGITYFMQLYCSFIMDWSIPALDCLFTGVCFHIAAEFQCLCVKFEHLAADIAKRIDTAKPDNPLQRKKALDQLKKLISRHSQILNLNDTSQTLFKEIVLVHFLLSAITICVNGVNLTIATMSEKPPYIAYICTLLTQAYIFCYSGELITQSSAAVVDCVSELPWYKMDKNFCMIVQIVIHRAQQYAVLEVPFFSVSLPVFVTILQASFSYITFLQFFLEQ